MYIASTLSLLLASAAFAAARGEQEQAQALRAPILASREFTPIEEAGLERRGTCPDGGVCFLGQCCGTGCSPNCCAHDNGGIGCNLAERCQFDGNVFVGCCNGFIGRCTGEATRVTVHTPADSTMFNTGAPATSDATTTSGDTRPTTAESPGLPTSESDSSSSSSSSTDSTSRSATSPTTSAQATRSTAGSSSRSASRSASSSASANDSAGTTASSTSAAQGGETGTVNAAPAITGYMGLELGAVAVGALLVL